MIICALYVGEHVRGRMAVMGHELPTPVLEALFKLQNK
jgi:hypothetical protein